MTSQSAGKIDGNPTPPPPLEITRPSREVKNSACMGGSVDHVMREEEVNWRRRQQVGMVGYCVRFRILDLRARARARACALTAFDHENPRITREISCRCSCSPLVGLPAGPAG